MTLMKWLLNRQTNPIPLGDEKRYKLLSSGHLSGLQADDSQVEDKLYSKRWRAPSNLALLCIQPSTERYLMCQQNRSYAYGVEGFTRSDWC